MRSTDSTGFQKRRRRYAPIMTRIGQELPLLQTIRGVEERASRLMTAERRQPDGGLFELLVSLAYRRGGWCRRGVRP